MYRELEFVERCACNEPAVAGCASCGRARCDFHLTKRLCVRCTEAIRRELVQRSSGRFAASMTFGTLVAVALLVVHSAAGIVLGIPLTIGALFWTRAWQRQRLIKQMGPSLAATKGELPPPPREPHWDPNTTNSASGYTPGGP